MKEFEINILQELLNQNDLRNIQLSEVFKDEVVEFSGAGYFVTIKDKRLPIQRVVLQKPDIRGILGNIDVGYIAFIENSELMLECFSYDNEVLPEHRDQQFIRSAT